jgi:hypothetical protein
MNMHTRTHRLIGDYVGSAWFYCMWVVVKKLWVSASSNIIDPGLNAGVSLLNAVADLALLVYLWPFTARAANMAELAASSATLCCYFILGAPVMFPGQVMQLLPSWCGDFTVMTISLTGASAQAVRVMSGPSVKVVKMCFLGIQSFFATTCGGKKPTV